MMLRPYRVKAEAFNALVAPRSHRAVSLSSRCVPARLRTFVECVRTGIGSPAYQDVWAGLHDAAEVAWIAGDQHGA